MADDFLEELGIDSEETQTNVEQVNKVEKRISELNKKVILTAKERDDLKEAQELLQSEKDTAVKERDFYAGFADSIAKYPGSNEYKEQIKEKVLSGYDIEDATIAILAKEGKYQPTMAETVTDTESPVGGSAVNQMNLKGEKSPREMNRDELREALLEAEKKGEFSIN